MIELFDTLERAFWTFVQALTASIVVTGGVGIGDLQLGLVAGALAVAKSLSVIATERIREVE